MKKPYKVLILLAIALISLAMHFNHFPKELMSIHVWRQTQTQSTINNFYEGDMNILNPARNDRGEGDGIYRMEFPLMQWLVALTYKVFGNHLIITRIFMFVVGLLSVLGMYRLLAALFKNTTLALIGAWAFNFSPSFYYYTINPLPDNLALCCSIWGLALFFAWYRKHRRNVLFASGLLLGIGALCKFPFILYFAVPVTYFLVQSVKSGKEKAAQINGIVATVSIILPLIWYIIVIPGWFGNGVVNGMLNNNEPLSVITDYLVHNLVSTLPELLLNYGSVIFFLAGFYFLVKNKSYKSPLFPALLVLSLVILGYFFFEINMIANIHDYYLFPFYPLLFILVAYGAYNLFSFPQQLVKYLVIAVLLILPLTAYLRMQVRWDADSPGFNKDLLTYKTELRNAVPKESLCIAGNDESHAIFFYYIDKKGWAFQDDALDADAMETMIDRGALYLYTDSRKIDTNPEIIPFLDSLILQKGSIRIYRLKTE